jgi:hypothetical protein
MQSEDLGVKVTTKRVVDAPTESKFPAVPKPLLERLDELFPDECPSLDLGDRQIWYAVGQRSVVALLIAEYEQQTRESQT